MATFTFKRAKTVYNGIKFLSSLVERTGQNNPLPSGKEHGCVITEATVRQVENDATGQVEFNCPEGSKKAFENVAREYARDNGDIQIDFQQ